MKVIVNYIKYGLQLNINKGASREDFINAYIMALGGPQGVLNNFLQNVSFVEDTIEEIEFKNDDNNRIDSKETPN